MIFHQHNWVKIKETFANPSSKGRYWTTREAMELQCGITTILFQCSKCSRIKKEEMLGKANK